MTSACTAWPRASKRSNKPPRRAPSNMPNGSVFCSNTRRRCAGRSASRRVPGPHACALGHKGCREDFSVLYHRMPRLFMALALARGDGRYAKLLRTLARVDLLVLDDWGPQQFNAEQRRDLLEIVEDRYDARSILITSQLPIERWYEVIGDPTLADAILDRIVHNAYRIELKGESIRKLKAATTEPTARKPAKEAPQNVTPSASTPAKVRRK